MACVASSRTEIDSTLLLFAFGGKNQDHVDGALRIGFEKLVHPMIPMNHWTSYEL